MSVSTELSSDKQVFTIKIVGCFDFHLVDNFRNSYAGLGTDISKVIIDLRETEYMDSSALGMLLSMRHTMENIIESICIKNCQPQIKKILQISRFDKKFEID